MAQGTMPLLCYYCGTKPEWHVKYQYESKTKNISPIVSSDHGYPAVHGVSIR